MSVWFKRVFLAVAVLGFFAAAPAAAQNGRAQDNGRPDVGGGRFLDVIVVLDESVAPGRGAANRSEAAAVAQAHGVTPSFVYGTALFGYAARIAEARLAVIEGDPRVAYVDFDASVSIPWPPVGAQALCDKKPDHPKCQPSDPPPEEDPPPPEEVTQVTPWGIGRIGADLSANTGADIDIYILDTGIANHNDLYVVERVNCTKRNPLFASCSSGGDDGNGHGTHVAGTACALDNAIDVVGVAPGCRLHAVKVLKDDGSGRFSQVIAGVDYVAAQANGPVVANMSLSGSGSKQGTCTESGFSGSGALHQAICGAARSGVVFAVAAGNARPGETGVDAENRVPAAYDDAVLTVTATSGNGDATVPDDWPHWSNWGDGTNDAPSPAPVAIAAPGENIRSTWNDGGLKTISGTSMASPHVAGAAALSLATNPQLPNYSAFENVRAALLNSAELTTTFDNTSGHPHGEDFLDASGL